MIFFIFILLNKFILFSSILHICAIFTLHTYTLMYTLLHFIFISLIFYSLFIILKLSLEKISTFKKYVHFFSSTFWLDKIVIIENKNIIQNKREQKSIQLSILYYICICIYILTYLKWSMCFVLLLHTFVHAFVFVVYNLRQFSDKNIRKK